MPTSSHRRRFLADMARLTGALPVIDWSANSAQERVPRIGFMGGAEPSLISSFEDEMRELGYSPGKLSRQLDRRNHGGPRCDPK